MASDGNSPDVLRIELDEISERNEMWGSEPVPVTMHLAEIINRGFEFLRQQPPEPPPLAMVLTQWQFDGVERAIRAGWVDLCDCLRIAILPDSIYG